MEDFMKAVVLMAVAVAMGLILTYPLMLCINYLFAPSLLSFIFGVPALTFWKTFALTIVLGFLSSRGSSKE